VLRADDFVNRRPTEQNRSVPDGGSIATAVALVGGIGALLFRLAQARRSRPSLRFDGPTWGGEQLPGAPVQTWRLYHRGVLRNASTEGNAVIQVGLVFWNDRASELIWESSAEHVVDQATGDTVALPLTLAPHGGRAVELRSDRTEEQIGRYLHPRIPPGPWVLGQHPRFQWEHLLRDSHGNWFRARGGLINAAYLRERNHARIELENANHYGEDRLGALFHFYIASRRLVIAYALRRLAFAVGIASSTQ
jgi:hypothetical protein